MLRAILLLILLTVAAVWVAPAWDRDARTLTLRLRDGDEIAAELRERARALGQRFVLGEGRETPAVGSGSGATNNAPEERLTAEDRARLDRLVEEKAKD